MLWGLLVAVLAAPAGSFLGYRRHVSAPRAAGLAALALVAATAGGFAALLYDYVLSVPAGLCGEDPSGLIWLPAAVAYAVVGSWSALRPGRAYAWALAPLAAAAALSLAAYFDAGSHGHCET